MKIFVRSLWGNDPKPLWSNDAQREALRHYLNDQGFYTLTGAGDSLEVYVIDHTEALDIRIAKKALEKFGKAWYILLGRKNF